LVKLLLVRFVRRLRVLGRGVWWRRLSFFKLVGFQLTTRFDLGYAFQALIGNSLPDEQVVKISTKDFRAFGYSLYSGFSVLFFVRSLARKGFTLRSKNMILKLIQSKRTLFGRKVFFVLNSFLASSQPVSPVGKKPNYLLDLKVFILLSCFLKIPFVRVDAVSRLRPPRTLDVVGFFFRGLFSYSLADLCLSSSFFLTRVFFTGEAFY